MMWYDGGGTQWWGWLLGAFMMVAVWGLIIWGIWYLVTSPTRNDTKPAASAGAKEILDMRLARGEIDAGDYDRLRKLIDTAAGQRPSEPDKVSVTARS
jgi:uncharacterized membrane protein